MVPKRYMRLITVLALSLLFSGQLMAKHGRSGGGMRGSARGGSFRGRSGGGMRGSAGARSSGRRARTGFGGGLHWGFHRKSSVGHGRALRHNSTVGHKNGFRRRSSINHRSGLGHRSAVKHHGGLHRESAARHHGALRHRSNLRRHGSLHHKSGLHRRGYSYHKSDGRHYRHRHYKSRTGKHGHHGYYYYSLPCYTYYYPYYYYSEPYPRYYYYSLPHAYQRYDSSYRYYDTPAESEPTPTEEPVERVDLNEHLQNVADAFATGDYDEAVRRAQEALSAEPEDKVLPFAHSQSLFAAQRYGEAAEVLREALRKADVENEGVFYTPGLYPDQEVLTEQIDKLSEIVQADSYNADLQLVLGYQLLGVGRHDEARQALREAKRDYVNRGAAEILMQVLEKVRP